MSTGYYGSRGSKATDEYKQGLYYKYMREWTNSAGISCFYFEAFNEPWKDAANQGGSENHFGLFKVDGQAKFVVWDLFGFSQQWHQVPDVPFVFTALHDNPSAPN